MNRKEYEEAYLQYENMRENAKFEKMSLAAVGACGHRHKAKNTRRR